MTHAPPDPATLEQSSSAAPARMQAPTPTPTLAQAPAQTSAPARMQAPTPAQAPTLASVPAPAPTLAPASAPRRDDAPPARPARYGPEDFPGCESFYLPANELEHYEGRLEFWDGGTETAWKVCEPTSIYHEKPSRLLGQMAGRFAMLRGSRIACFGSADLERVDAKTRRRHWLMQADEVLYLHPDRVRLEGPGIDVDTDPLPDVVLEVDHTTDARRRKLGFYKESGFPEIWVLVPWESSRRAPGLVIHVRRGGVYREEGESRAFPGWSAEEIHLALTEDPLSEVAWRALERVALGMGAREGRRPEDDPLTGSLSGRAEARGHARGHREGHAQGHREGHREGHARGHREGRAQGHREGHAQGDLEGHARGRLEERMWMMHRMAARKFGAETAARLVERLEGLGDWERMAEVGDWLVECESGEALLGRVERLCASSAGGGVRGSVRR